MSSAFRTSLFNRTGIPGFARILLENPIHYITDLFIVNNIDNSVLSDA